MYRRVRRMSRKVPWRFLFMIAGCAAVLAVVMVLPSMMGWEMSLEVQLLAAGALFAVVALLSYKS